MIGQRHVFSASTLKHGCRVQIGQNWSFWFFILTKQFVYHLLCVTPSLHTPWRISAALNSALGLSLCLTAHFSSSHWQKSPQQPKIHSIFKSLPVTGSIQDWNAFSLQLDLSNLAHMFEDPSLLLLSVSEEITLGFEAQGLSTAYHVSGLSWRLQAKNLMWLELWSVVVEHWCWV